MTISCEIKSNYSHWEGKRTTCWVEEALVKFDSRAGAEMGKGSQHCHLVEYCIARSRKIDCSLTQCDDDDAAVYKDYGDNYDGDNDEDDYDDADCEKIAWERKTVMKAFK